MAGNPTRPVLAGGGQSAIATHTHSGSMLDARPLAPYNILEVLVIRDGRTARARARARLKSNKIANHQKNERSARKSDTMMTRRGVWENALQQLQPTYAT